METKTVIKIRYWALTDEIIRNLQELSEKYEKMADDSIDSETSQLYLSSLAPLSLIDRKLQDLRAHIQRYARKSMPLIINLRTIDQQMANSDLLPDRSVMIADLRRITDDVITDIKKKQGFLENFIDPAKTFNMAFILEHADILKEIREICRHFTRILDEIAELIQTFSKYTCPESAIQSPDAKMDRRKRMLRKVYAALSEQHDKKAAARQLVAAA